MFACLALCDPVTVTWMYDCMSQIIQENLVAARDILLNNKQLMRELEADIDNFDCKGDTAPFMESLIFTFASRVAV